MPLLEFDILIQASRQTVWDTLFTQETYRQWTAPFCEGSHYQGSWEEGQQIRFLDPQGSGMLATIQVNRPLEHLAIRHLGEIREGAVDPDSLERFALTDALETYTLTEATGGTQLHIELAMDAAYAPLMQAIWPKALAELKRLCEQP